jgi:hypothetical protein
VNINKGDHKTTTTRASIESLSLPASITFLQPRSREQTWTAEKNQYSEAELVTNDQEITGASIVCPTVKRKEM